MGGFTHSHCVSLKWGQRRTEVNCQASHGEQNHYRRQYFILSASSSTDPDIVNGVYWSEALNKVFVDNFERDPTLIWQYFGSAKGFFRQYPGQCSHGAARCVSV